MHKGKTKVTAGAQIGEILYKPKEEQRAVKPPFIVLKIQFKSIFFQIIFFYLRLAELLEISNKNLSLMLKNVIGQEKQKLFFKFFNLSLLYKIKQYWTAQTIGSLIISSNGNISIKFEEAKGLIW